MTTIETSCLHIYAQALWHDEALIIGDREAIEKLREACDKALLEGKAKESFMVSDGEGYDLYIAIEDGIRDANFVLPYTDFENIGINQKECVQPWDLLR
jgi:hypothetical protein